MSASHKFLKIARQIHLYIGVFIAPALLFFAFTGGLQVFSLHETTRGSEYKPPAWLATMAQLHKKQSLAVPMRKPRLLDVGEHPSALPAAAPAADATPLPSSRPDMPRMQARNPLPLKIFAALVALGLFVSTLLGIYMAWRYTRKPVMIAALLAAGVAIPIVLAIV